MKRIYIIGIVLFSINIIGALILQNWYASLGWSVAFLCEYQLSKLDPK